MDKIMEASRDLNLMITDSEEYKNYIYARNSIKANEELYDSLMQFKRQYEDIMKYTDGNPYDDLLRVYYENDDLIHNSVVNDFLRAESALTKLLKSTIERVTAGIRFEE